MNIHIISTPDVHPELMLALQDLFQDHMGSIDIHYPSLRWHNNDLLSINQHRFSDNFKFRIESEYKIQHYDPQRGYPLSWRELFFLCEKTRKVLSIPDEDFIILVSNRRNSLNWFSAFSQGGDRNAFVQASDWEFFLKTSPEFPVAYEIVANVLRILMKFDLNTPAGQNFHLAPLGCVNDFCADKSEILIKLRTADICPDCMQKLESENVPVQIIRNILEFLEKIRIQMKWAQGFLGTVKPEKLHISDKGSITIGNRDLKLTPLETTLFIFFLHHPEGVRIAELIDFQEELFSIYQKLKPNADPKNIRDLVTKFDGTYSYNKSRLTKKIRSLLGNELAQYYIINGIPGETFKIPLKKDMVCSAFSDDRAP